MRPHDMLTASAALLSAQALLVFGNEVGNGIPYYQPKEVKPEVAVGGLQKLIDRGVLRLEKTPEGMHGQLSWNSQGNRRRNLQAKHAPGETTSETRNAGQYGGTRAGAKQRQYLEGGKSAAEASESVGEAYYHDGHHTANNANYASVERAVQEDLSAEEIVTLSAFQDNRFASPDPIYVTPENPDVEATGNVWIYADVPLQELFGIDVDPLIGFVQGTCQGIFSNQDGYCSFTYEFFDGLEVIATMAVQGATQPTGPSILTVVGGTGDLEGVSGEVSLIPASLDTTVTPPTVIEDDSLFLGNPAGYYMEAVLYIRYGIAVVPDDDAAFPADDVLVDDFVMPELPTGPPVVMPEDPSGPPAAAPTPVRPPTGGDDTDDLVDMPELPTAVPVDEPTTSPAMGGPSLPPILGGTDDFGFSTVQCLGEVELCDCTDDTCTLSPCMCDEAQAPSCCDGSGLVRN